MYILLESRLEKVSKKEFILTSIAISIVISSMISTVFSFLKYNGIEEYFIAASVLIVTLHLTKIPNLKKYGSFILSYFDATSTILFNWKSIVIFSLLLPFLLMAIRPFDETDSMFNSNFMLNWIFNQTTPYVMANNYVPTWELTYVPSWVIVHADWFFWLSSIKPVIIIGVGTYLIGYKIGLPRILNYSTVFTGIIFFLFWVDLPSGISTLKNDAIFAAGIILVAVATLETIRRGFNKLSIIVLITAFIFISTKYSGIVMIIVFSIFFIIFNRKQFSKNHKKIIGWSLITITILMLTTGHYYLHNWLQFENPFYPIKITVFGAGFSKGTVDLAGTSILSSLNDKHLWQTVFTMENLSRVGYLFPVILGFGIIGTIGYVFHSFFYYKVKKIDHATIFLSFFIFTTWILYFGTYWSASASPGDLFYVKTLASLRYVEGTFVITELLFIYMLWRLKFPTISILAILGIDSVSRYLYLVGQLPNYLDYRIMIYPIVVMIGMFILGRYLKKISLKIIIVLVISFCIFVLSVQQVETNREGWVIWWHDVVSRIYDLPSSKIILISDTLTPGFSWPIQYPVYGDRLQHSLSVESEKDLVTYLSELSHSKTLSDSKPDYVVLLCNPNVNCRQESLDVTSQLSEFGYNIFAINDHSLLLKYNNTK